MPSETTPAPVLKSGFIYSGDNGARFCVECAGQTALYTGFDRSGLKCRRMSKTGDAKAWFEFFKKPLACECGKTVYATPE